MRSFRRTLLKALAFLGSILLLTIAITEPYFQSETFHYQDAAVRDSFAGTLDTLICGSSHAYRAIKPTTLDDRLGTFSYNLSSSLMTMAGRYELLKKELNRNPVKLVILDASYNSLTRNRDKEGPEGDLYQLGRYNNIFERASYFFRHIRLDEYWQVYYDTLSRSKDTYYSLLQGSGFTGTSVKYETRGYLGAPTTPCTPPDPSNKHGWTLPTKVDPESLKYMEKMVTLCQEKGVPVVVVVTPISTAGTLRWYGMDDFRAYLEDYCQQWNVPLMDFNLFKGKTALFLDEDHYYDAYHMSDAGADVFCQYFADVLELWQAGKPYDALFYDSYAQAEEAAMNGTDIYDPSYKK